MFISLSPWLETSVMAGTLSALPSPPRASVISGMYLLGSAVLPSMAPSSHISWLRLGLLCEDWAVLGSAGRHEL